MTTAILAVAMLSTGLSGTASAARSPDVDPSVITSWNEVAVATIVTDAGKANVEAFVYLAFVQAAVYNAVVGITRDYELYKWERQGPWGASPEAAAAAAAHKLLLTYFPASQARLDAALAASLANVTDGWREREGVEYGRRAANRIIALRADDGRYATLPFEQQLKAGVWRPAPPGFAPFFATWLSQLRPMTYSSPSRFRPGPPPGLRSDRYAAEFDEVKSLGSKTSTTRTAHQTETGMFTSDTGIGPFQASLRDLAKRHGMDISETARLFAAADVSVLDAIIATWDAKFHYGFWRPITAIQLAADDGNPDTVADPTWEPMLPTPPYPDYTSGYTAVAGSLSGAVARILGDGRADLYITSTAAGMGGPPVTRYYRYASRLNTDAINGRIYLGYHFRTADRVGSQIGRRVANWVMEHQFEPI